MPGTQTNDLYTRIGDFVRLTRAQGPEVEAEFDAVQTGFDNVETETDKKIQAPDAASGWTFPTATGNGGKILQFPNSGTTLGAVGISELSLGSGLILDEDEFGSNSEDDAPSQQSVLAYLGNYYTKNDATDLSAKSWFLDEDNMASDDALKVASQQSVKKYVDDQVSATSSIAIATTENLKIVNNTSNPTTQLDIAADKVLFADSSGTVLRKTSVSITVDITTTGAKNGLGTSLTEASDTWYYVWLGWDEGGAAVYGWLDTSATGANDPDTDNTYKVLVGLVRNNSSSNLIAIRQRGPVVHYQARQSIASSLSATSYTTQAVSALIPTASGLTRAALFGAFANSADTYVWLSDDGTNAKTIFIADSSLKSVGDQFELYQSLSAGPIWMPLDGNNVYYKVDVNNITLLARGYELNLPLG